MTEQELDRAFYYGVLKDLELLSQGSTTRWDASGSAGKPGSKVLAMRDAEYRGRTIAGHFRWRYDRAAGPTSKRAVYDDATRELAAWRGHGIKRPEGESQAELNSRMLWETRGMDPRTAASTSFRMSEGTIRSLRKRARLSTETGEVMRGSDREETIAAMAAQGMVQMHIAGLLGVSQSTVSRTLGQRRDRFKRAA